jgi:GNAT superfamily N-acetyltransferase
VTFKIAPIHAVGDHIGVIQWIDKVCFPDEGHVAFDGAYWWAAYDEKNKTVGIAALTYFPERTAFLSRVGVLPGFRGNGLHRRFVRAREREAKRNGYTRMVTYTSKENVVSSNNLIKCGYRLYTPEYNWGLPYGLYWQRFLQATE